MKDSLYQKRWNILDLFSFTTWCCDIYSYAAKTAIQWKICSLQMKDSLYPKRWNILDLFSFTTCCYDIYSYAAKTAIQWKICSLLMGNTFDLYTYCFLALNSYCWNCNPMSYFSILKVNMLCFLAFRACCHAFSHLFLIVDADTTPPAPFLFCRSLL